jgi:hypothetical protein
MKNPTPTKKKRKKQQLPQKSSSRPPDTRTDSFDEKVERIQSQEGEEASKVEKFRRGSSSGYDDEKQ